jgi:DNA-binding FadR family transcriptional regulator
MTSPMTDILGSVESPPKYAEVQKQIRRFILSKSLRPGDRLPTESQIATAIGVSRTAVREGLRSLEALGIIEARQGDGRYVRAFNFDAVLDDLLYCLVFEAQPVVEALQVREALEVGFIERAAKLLTEEDLRDLRENVARMRERALRHEAFFIDEDMSFHRILFRRLGNTILLRILSYFWALFCRLLDHPSLCPQDPMAIVRIHEEILAAVEARSDKRARDALTAHFAEVHARLSRVAGVMRSSQPAVSSSPTSLEKEEAQ